MKIIRKGDFKTMELKVENGFTELSMNEMNETEGGIPTLVVWVLRGIVSGVVSYGTNKLLESVFG